ncbi:uncharacterized protein LOC126655812 [Mercurialis annua]|uniref:uncharacterized protein LOC126655812 n=1 Tax=Mercurialis annua TaxID=3986 RepID=UPI00215E3BC4|nr:uncharacterized protein LOC126655812 [Mercurialis annua]XP_050206088.1 uncharacterized protein LOC126655812 [Mercurialis annua]
MGAACCIAAREKDLPDTTGGNIFHRNARCSPTWSFRWENRRRVAGEIEDSPYQTSQALSRDISVEVKDPLGSDRDNLSDEGSLHESFGTPFSLRSPSHERGGTNLIAQPSGLSLESNSPAQEKNSAESPGIVDISAPKLSFSTHSSFSTPVADPLRIHGLPLPPNSTPSRRACRSPGHRLFRQISDSRILGLKSPNNHSLSEGRSSFVLSTCSNGLRVGSIGGSSDGWSMRTFSELVASSQRERWSFDSEHFGYGFGKLSGCSSRFSCSPSLDPQSCGACSKLLMERSSWRSNELAAVAVLVCGHVYHADCLETMTLEVDKYDPACPICMGGENKISKISAKALKSEAALKARSHKISRNRVVDSYLDTDSDDCDYQKAITRRVSKMEPSSSSTSSSTKQFLKRRFPFGAKWSRSLSENDSTRKKGFWARYRK